LMAVNILNFSTNKKVKLKDYLNISKNINKLNIPDLSSE